MRNAWMQRKSLGSGRNALKWSEVSKKNCPVNFPVFRELTFQHDGSEFRRNSACLTKGAAE